MKDYGINGHKSVLKNLKNVMKAVNQKYSIKVGIIGEKAFEKHPDSNLTNAQLGAVHEFGAVIPVTDKMRAFFRSQGVYLKKTTTHISIPARSFLRAVLLNKEVQEQLYEAAGLSSSRKDRELNKEIVLLQMMKGNTQIMQQISEAVGEKALELVQTAFITGGYPDRWPPITELTKEWRKGEHLAPPLTDTGALLDSISFEVRKVK